MEVHGKHQKKVVLERILQQYQQMQKENKKLCDLYSELTGVNAHQVQCLGIEPESTIHLILRLRGGMYHESSGRAGFEPVAEGPEREVQGLVASVQHALRNASYFEKMAQLYMQVIERSKED